MMRWLGAVLCAAEFYAWILAAAVGMIFQQSAFRAGALTASMPTFTVAEPVVASVLGVIVLGETVDAGDRELPVLIAAVVVAILALALGEHRWIASTTLWISLAWAIVMLSGISVTALVWMVRRGDAARATALMFLVPPFAALQGYFGFGEVLLPVQIAGFVAALLGVLLARS